MESGVRVCTIGEGEATMMLPGDRAREPRRHRKNVNFLPCRRSQPGRAWAAGVGNAWLRSCNARLR